MKKFYIYDNNSSIPLISSMMTYVSAGLVEYNYFKGWDGKGYKGSTQQWAYNDCLSR